MHWDASSTTLLFHIHSKSAVFDNPIFVRLSFHLPDTPLCVMKYPHLTSVEADECNVIVDAVNASFRTRCASFPSYFGNLMRICVNFRAVAPF
jgi:hypothetical protein